MNILELCLSPGLGGLELYTYRASMALSEKHHITVVVLENSKLDDYYKENSTLKRLHIKNRRNPLPLINARKLARILDDNNIDVIHMHWGKDLALVAFSKYFSKKKPALVYTRQMMITRAKNDFYHNFLYGQMDLMLTITRELESLAKLFINRCENKITTLYYGVTQPDKFLDKETIKQQREALGFSENDFIVGLIGRLEEGKGQHLLFKAITMAKQHGINIKALIVGHEMDAGYRKSLKEMTQSLAIEEMITFMDFTKKPQKLMQICDCIVLASYEETFGLVLAEAMRAGVAVIGSNKGGVPEIIDHTNTGLLFESKNAPSLYQQIKRLCQDTDLKNTLATQGMKKADKTFNNEAHYDALEKHFQSLVS